MNETEGSLTGLRNNFEGRMPEKTWPKVFDFVTKHKIDKLEDLSIKDKGGIYFAKFPLLPFSSTDIRTKMSQKKSIENLVTPEVSDFIKKTASYSSDGHKI